MDFRVICDHEILVVISRHREITTQLVKYRRLVSAPRYRRPRGVPFLRYFWMDEGRRVSIRLLCIVSFQNKLLFSLEVRFRQHNHLVRFRKRSWLTLTLLATHGTDDTNESHD